MVNFVHLKFVTNIEKLSMDKSELDSNAWLAGFTDSDGNFYIQLYGKYSL